MEFNGGPPPSRLWLALLLFPLPIALGGVYLLTAKPRLAYRVDPARVVIDAGLGSWDQGRIIPKGDIQQVAAVDIGRARRVAGTGMPGYCQGRFDVDGTSAWIATDCGRAVVRLDTKDGVVFVSPEDRAGFVAAAQSPAGTGEFAAPAHERPAWPLMLAPLLILPLMVVPLLALKIFKPMRYRIEGGELIVPAHLKEVRVQLRGAKVRRGDPGTIWRLAGSGLPGFHMGRYRAFGESVHMAATRRKDLVLVEGDRRVAVSPDDPEGFMAALGAAGATVVTAGAPAS